MQVPWGIAFLPNGDALVSERARGRIYRVSRHGGKHLVGTITAVDNNAGEGGLLGLAIHPNFKKNRWVYAYYTVRPGQPGRALQVRATVRWGPAA